MISWSKQGADKIKCDLKQLDHPAQPKTAFTQKVIFIEEFSAIFIKMFKENVLDKCGDWRIRERKVILREDDQLFPNATCVRYNIFHSEFIY